MLCIFKGLDANNNGFLEVDEFFTLVVEEPAKDPNEGVSSKPGSKSLKIDLSELEKMAPK